MRIAIPTLIFFCLAGLLLGACGHAGIDAARRGDIGGLKAWLAEGAKVDEPGSGQRTALQAGAVAGQAEAVAWLIGKGANPNAVEDEGDSALCLIFRPKKTPDEAKVARALAEGGADVNKKCGDGKTPMELASIDYRWDALVPLLEKGAKTQRDYPKADDPLCKAALSARADVVALMLKNGEDPNRHGSAAIFDALNTPQKDSWEVVKLLVENGTNLKVQQPGDGTGDTALHRVVLLRDLGSARIVDIMVNHGADPYAINRNQEIPLDTAMTKSEDISNRMVKHMALELPASEPLKKAYDKMVMAAIPGASLATIERMMAAAGYARVQSKLAHDGAYDAIVKDATRKNLFPVANEQEAEMYKGFLDYTRALVGALANAAAEGKLTQAQARENFESLMKTIVGDTKRQDEKRRLMGAGRSPAAAKVLNLVKLLRDLEAKKAK